MRNENTCTHIFSFLMGNLSLLTDWRGKLSSQQQEACQTGKASGREQIPLWSITITLVGAEGNHTASSRNVAWVLGPPAAATGLRKGLHDTSVTEVGMTSDASQPLRPAEHQGAGPQSEEKGLCAASHRSEGV